jgi:uncharacterized membrane protein YedE/YeeE
MNLDLASIFPLGWAHYLVGGLVMGLGMALLFVATGLMGGMSTVFSSTWSFVSRRPFFQQDALRGSRRWRLVYAVGLVLGAGLWWLLLGPSGRVEVTTPLPLLFVGGLVAGYGARLANGCTAGHGICGLASLQRPSAVAVLVFMATAFLTANLTANLTAYWPGA